MVHKLSHKNSNSSSRDSKRSRTDHDHLVADYDTALDLAGYGPFSKAVLIACVLAFFTTGVENCTMSYVLPAARCELALTTYQVGLVNMAFMCGGTASAFFWGIVGDVFGRRNIISFTLLLNAIITLGQSFSYDYRVLLAARTINGFLIGGPSTLVFTYLSDLVGGKRRELYLTMVGLGFVAAWLILPAVAWLVIPFKIAYPTILPIYSWRLYLALGSLPSFIGGIWMLFLPESPRLLADTNRSDEALQLLSQIHKWNGYKNEKYRVKKLIVSEAFPKPSIGENSRTKELFFGVLRDLRMFVSKAYAFKSSLILFVFFANMAAGFGLNLWIPELLLRVQGRDCPITAALSDITKEKIKNIENYPNINENTSSNPLSLVNAMIPENHSLNVGGYEKFSERPCNDTIGDDIFTSGLIVGACCVLGNAACAILCSKGGGSGVRRAATACTLACAVASACLAASACSCVTSSKIAVAAAAALNAASLNGNVLLIRLLLHALPPKLSGLGVCWGAWWGRAGGVASNFAVGILLDMSCPAPFIAVAALLAISIGAILMIRLEDTDEEMDNIQTDTIEKNMTLDKYISTHM